MAHSDKLEEGLFVRFVSLPRVAFDLRQVPVGIGRERRVLNITHRDIEKLQKHIRAEYGTEKLI